MRVRLLGPTQGRTTINRIATLVLSLAMLGAAQAASGQQQPNCPCRLSLTKTLELNSAGAQIAPSFSVSVAHHPRDGYLVSHLHRPPAIAHYGLDGKIIRTYSRRGSGPLELTTAALLVAGRGDTVLVFDRNRLHRFTTDLHPIDSKRLSTVTSNSAVSLASGAIAVDYQLRTNEHAYLMFSIINAEGNATSHLRAAESPGLVVLGPSRAAGVWAALPNESVVREYSSAGDLKRTIMVKRDWFAPWTGKVSMEGFTTRPRPRTASVNEWRAGQILLTTTVADSAWRPLWDPSTERMFNAATIDFSVMFDTVLEVIDLTTMTVIASARVGQSLSRVQGTSDLYYSTREIEDGNIITDVWRVILHTR